MCSVRLRDSHRVKNETARTEKHLITQLQQAKYLSQLLNKNLFPPRDVDRIKISCCRVIGSKNELIKNKHGLAHYEEWPM